MIECRVPGLVHCFLRWPSRPWRSPLQQPASAAGDPVRGKTLGYTCLGCHGIETYKNVYPTYSVPRLRGQHPEYIVAALKAYGSSERGHATMHAHASSLSDQDMQDLAAYLGGEAIKPAKAAADAAGMPAAVATCAACHGRDGVGIMGIYPTLSGQHADYLEHTLNDYRSGARKNGIMAPFASPAEARGSQGRWPSSTRARSRR